MMERKGGEVEGAEGSLASPLLVRASSMRSWSWLASRRREWMALGATETACEKEERFDVIEKVEVILIRSEVQRRGGP